MNPFHEMLGMNTCFWEECEAADETCIVDRSVLSLVYHGCVEMPFRPCQTFSFT